MEPIHVDVLIAGGGGSGLSASCFLADLGVSSLLVERHPGTSHLPKAHYMNMRTMEVFRQHGIAAEVYKAAAPRENLGEIVWRMPLGRKHHLDGRVIKAVGGLGGGELAPIYDRYGVTPPTNIPQLYLEPILRRIAERRNPDRVLFHHELVSFEETSTGVEAIIRDRDSGAEFPVTARYLIGADGGKTVGPQIGVNMIAPSRIASRVTVHFRADLSSYIDYDTSVMHCIINPHGAMAGRQLSTYLLAYGPERFGRHSQEWSASLIFGPDEDVSLDHDDLAERLCAFFQIDTPIEVLRSSRWFQEAMVANHYGTERILLVGDAVHKHPPASGLGLNSGIQDVHNVCWKLALVLNGKASPELLHSYGRERRPIALRNSDHAMQIMENFELLVASVGLRRDASAEYNEGQLEKYFADTPDGAERRARVDHVFKLTRSELGCLDLDIGFTYPDGAIVDDGLPFPPRDPATVEYTPSTRPGCRLPHEWLKIDHETLSTHDLIPMGGFLLLTDKQGSAWCSAAAELAGELGIPIRAVQVTEGSDPDGSWARQSEVSAGGAILVRPDAHVGYRSQTLVSNPKAALHGALAAILGRPEAPSTSVPGGRPASIDA